MGQEGEQIMIALLEQLVHLEFKNPSSSESGDCAAALEDIIEVCHIGNVILKVCVPEKPECD